MNLDKNIKIKTDSLDITYYIIYILKRDCSEAFKTRTFNITVAWFWNVEIRFQAARFVCRFCLASLCTRKLSLAIQFPVQILLFRSLCSDVESNGWKLAIGVGTFSRGLFKLLCKIFSCSWSIVICSLCCLFCSRCSSRKTAICSWCCLFNNKISSEISVIWTIQAVNANSTNFLFFLTQMSYLNPRHHFCLLYLCTNTQVY